MMIFLFQSESRTFETDTTRQEECGLGAFLQGVYRFGAGRKTHQLSVQETDNWCVDLFFNNRDRMNNLGSL